MRDDGGDDDDNDEEDEDGKTRILFSARAYSCISVCSPVNEKGCRPRGLEARG